MFRFQPFNYPYHYPYYKYYNNYIQPMPKYEEKSSITDSSKISNTTNSKETINNEQAIFEIYGIKFYLDDLIILGILFFLYQQNVKDEMLYIILFLLLFS